MPQNNKIKIRRGIQINLPLGGTEDGELRYSIDSQKLYIDDGTQNVEIGGNLFNFPISTATQAALNAKQDDITLTTTGTSGAATLVGATLNIPQYQSVITNPITGTGTTNYVSKFTGSGSIGDSLIFDNGTNVGIGTASPNQKLDIVGNARIRNGSYDGTIFFGDSNSNYFGYYSNDSYYKTIGNQYFQSEFSYKGVWDSAGNLGVGLTNPSSRFHVNGLSILTNPSGDNYNENLRLPQAAGGYASIALGGPVATVGTSVQQWTILKDPSNNFMIRHFGTDHLFINSDGNVGLGTGNPSEKLTVNGNIYASQGGLIAYRTDGGTGLDVNGGDLGSGSYIARFKNYSNVDKVVIKGNGNVGVSGEISSNYSSNRGTLWLGEVVLQDASFTSYGVLDYTLHNGGGYSHIMRVQGNGNIGIGTTNPNYTLDVNGFIGATRLYPANSNNTYITGDGNAGMDVTGSGYFYVTAVGGSYFQKEVRFRNIISNDTGAYLQINGGTTGATYFAGTIRVGTQTAEPSAILHLESTTQGFLPPRMSDAEMNSISSPVAGLMIFNNDIGSIFVFDGGSWRKIAYA